MADLNTNVQEVFNNRALLDRVVRSIQLDRDCDYLTALEAFHDAAESATNEGAPTLRRALDYAADADYCDQTIKLLERRDTAVGAAGKQAAKKLDQADELGRVKLSAGKAARILAGDPTTVQKRLMRARKLDPNAFIGEEGAAQFRALDREYATVGLDWLKTTERPRKEAAAEAQVAQVAKMLDDAIGQADGKRRRLLEAEAKLDGVENASAREAALGELRDQMDATVQEPLRMLDRPKRAGRQFLLDQGKTKKSKRGKKAKSAKDLPSDAAKMDRRVRRRLDRLGRPASDYVFALEAEVRGEAMPAKPRKKPESPPDGVFSGNLAVHAAVLERMKELDAPEADYPRILEQVLREEAS